MVKRVKFTSKTSSTEITELKKLLDAGTMLVAGNNKELRPEKHASDYGQCMRKVWFRILASELDYSEPEEIPPRVHRIFQNGHSAHDRLGVYFSKHSDLKFEEEIVIPVDDTEVHGRCDGICYLNNKPMVVEFKTINKRVVNEVKPEHKGQVTWYMAMWKYRRKQLKKDFGLDEFEGVSEVDMFGVVSSSGLLFDDLPSHEKWLLLTEDEIRGEVIYESKHTNETYHFPVPFDQILSDHVRLWFNQLQYHVDVKEIPQINYVKSRFPCSWGSGRCSYYEQCWGDDGIQKQDAFK